MRIIYFIILATSFSACEQRGQKKVEVSSKASPPPVPSANSYHSSWSDPARETRPDTSRESVYNANQSSGNWDLPMSDYSSGYQSDSYSSYDTSPSDTFPSDYTTRPDTFATNPLDQNEDLPLSQNDNFVPLGQQQITPIPQPPNSIVYSRMQKQPTNPGEPAPNLSFFFQTKLPQNMRVTTAAEQPKYAISDTDIQIRPDFAVITAIPKTLILHTQNTGGSEKFACELQMIEKAFQWGQECKPRQ